MDFYPRSESARSEQIVSKFLLKSLHIILDSRISSLRPSNRNTGLSSDQGRKSKKWFNLLLGDRPAALDNLSFWHRNLTDPMIIDIILVHNTVETVIERWVIQYESNRVRASPTSEGSANYKKTYKRAIMLLRSLYSTLRLLPAHKIFRQLNSSSYQSHGIDVIYKVSSVSVPFSRTEEETMTQYSFVPVEAFPGSLCISVTYRATLSDFNLNFSKSLPTNIITDYVGSPTTETLRAFSCSTEKGVGATSFSLRGTQPSSSSSPSQRPHSWTGGTNLHNRLISFKQHQSYGVSPPDMYSPNRFGNYRSPIHQKATSFDEYELSPPFSQSPSPSPPSYLSGGTYHMKTRTHSETNSAPVSIPRSFMAESSRYISPCFSEPNRHSLPPLSPRSKKIDISSSNESPSGMTSFRKSEALRAGDFSPGQKVFRDSKDDSGRFSGLLSSSGSPRVGFSRSSSRLSFQDDMDDDFSYPFVVDDVDTSDSHASQSVYGRKESPSHAFPLGRQSQGAAVGALVHMLRTAPPLRQDSSCYSFKTEFEQGGVSADSGSFMPRKISDALEELKSYREMTDHLLSKSGSRLVSKEEA